MSYELTTFSTVTLHELDCRECYRYRHPTCVCVPQLTTQLGKLRQKKRATEKALIDASFEVADIERKIRECAQKGREEYKSILVNRLSVHAGFLHMLLRYSLILKQDTKRLHYMISQAGRSGPLPILTFTDQAESELALSAPDLGALLIYDFYPAQPNNVGDNEDEDEEIADYSIIRALYSSLTN